MSFFKRHYPLTLTLFLAAMLRVAALLRYGDFWGDELFSFVYSQKPWLESLTHFWVWETNPPLHLLLLKLWFYIVPANEFTARLPSLIAGLATIAVLYFFIEKIWNRRTATISALLLSLSAYHIYLSATARGYTLLLLLSVCSTKYFYELFFNHATTRKNYFLFCFFNLLLLYTHLTSIALLFSQFLVLLVINKSTIKKWLLLLAPPFVLWSIWAIPSLLTKLNTQTVHGAWFLHLSNDPSLILKTISFLTLGPNLWLPAILLAALVSFLLGKILHETKSTTTRATPLLFLIILTCIPFLGALFLGLWNIKFVIIVLPTLTALAALTIDRFIKSTLLAAATVFLITIPGLIGVFHFLPLENWHAVASILKEQETPQKKQLILTNNLFHQLELNHYYAGTIPVRAYLPNKTSSNDFDFYIVTQNYLRVNQTDAQITNWLDQNTISRYSDLYVLQDQGVPINIFHALEHHGWKQTAPLPALRLIGNQLLLHYVKA